MNAPIDSHWEAMALDIHTALHENSFFLPKKVDEALVLRTAQKLKEHVAARTADLRDERNALLIEIEEHARHFCLVDHMSQRDRLKAIHEMVAEFLDEHNVPLPADRGAVVGNKEEP